MNCLFFLLIPSNYQGNTVSVLLNGSLLSQNSLNEPEN